MVKKLPQVKKGLKEFILDEDAKVIDKTATKIALTGVFLGFTFFDSIENVFSGNDHSNYLNALDNYKIGRGDGEYDGYPDAGIHAGLNPSNETSGVIQPKTLETVHSNHYNHSDGGCDIMDPPSWFGSGESNDPGNYTVTAAKKADLIRLDEKNTDSFVSKIWSKVTGGGGSD